LSLCLRLRSHGLGGSLGVVECRKWLNVPCLARVGVNQGLTEAEVCMRIDSMLYGQGWDMEHIMRERPITDGSIAPDGRSGKRNPPLKPDYILCLEQNFAVAVIEAKSSKKHPGEGIQQAIRYARMLGANFAYATNGEQIYEYDFTARKEMAVSSFPTRAELRQRLQQSLGIPSSDMDILLRPFNRENRNVQGKIMEPRYYQETAVQKAIAAILDGKKRLLLTMATGTGKTFVAFQIAHRLWKSGTPRPKILFLADRDALLKQAMYGAFSPFGSARRRIKRRAETAYDMYFALYQALDANKSDDDEDEDESNLARVYRQYESDFFDYIIIDECHRGSSTEGGQWRNILNYFNSAVHIGMTATPKDKANAESKGTYDYFGSPTYEYSLKQGIQDGFLAPYRIYKVELSIDQDGYVPRPGETDRNGRPLEDRTYGPSEFDRTIIVESRRKTVARHLVDFMRRHSAVYDKTIVFCQDSEHALAMTRHLRNYSEERHSYAVRIVAAEGEIGREYLEQFKSVMTDLPVIAVTSQLLSTGIDVQTCKIIVLDKTINSLTEFKQIIGRGTRVLEAHNKMWFKIVDYRNVTKLFRDPSWDGDPDGEIVTETVDDEWQPEPLPPPPPPPPPHTPMHKLHVDGGYVEVEGMSVRIFDESSGKPRLLTYTDYTGEWVRCLADTQSELVSIWTDITKRKEFIQTLQNVGITPEQLKEVTNIHTADLLDMLLQCAFDAKHKTRRERVNGVLQKPFLAKFPDAAKAILEVMLDHYAEHGYQELEGRKVIGLQKFEEFGGPAKIIAAFGGGAKFDEALQELIEELYSLA